MKIAALGLLMAVFGMVALGQRPVTIFLAGDSTIAEKLPEKRPETGWGEKLGEHFKPGTVKIDNRAANGRSTKTFISEGRWQKIVDDLVKGDYVLVQFGHNDSSKDKGERYTSPEDYRKNLVRFIDEVKAKGGFPILLTPVMRRRFDAEGKFYDTHGEYPGIVRAVAREYKVPMIDLQRLSEALIIRFGVKGSRKLFLQLKQGDNANYPNGIEDNTHFSPMGADEIAKVLVESLRKLDLGLSRLLR